MSILLLLVFISFVFLLIFWYNWRKRLISKFKRNGIPGPEPHLIFGNIVEYSREGYVKCHEMWIKKYGPVVGYFLGGKPFLLVSDPELLKLIQIKDFHLFAKRPLTVDTGLNPSRRLNHSLISCEENRWKQMRSTLTPTFSGSKLRQMTPIIELTID
jgi:cytochrome P450